MLGKTNSGGGGGSAAKATGMTVLEAPSAQYTIFETFNADTFKATLDYADGRVREALGTDGDVILKPAYGSPMTEGTGFTGQLEVDGQKYLWNYNVVAEDPDPILENNSWTIISATSASGQASNFWSVGDRKSVYISSFANCTANNTYYLYILGFNHNAALQGNGIHFQLGFSAASGGAHIALVDSGYNSSKTSGNWFNMNNSNTNSGG